MGPDPDAVPKENAEAQDKDLVKAIYDADTEYGLPTRRRLY